MGISERQILGTLLTWLQDKTSAVFAIATLNRLDALNKGRKLTKSK
ncbi:hypothetical protein G7B40_028645 [Aetokthonos hydrillicola Thurmond2011]|uniref:Uncharacterized protein n=1 Tax=Aetokthonos hydrillicola Thurmond2011 TaxID=2712845 RepID=A0AAP5IEC4_9CYAN|nr:hypothetical protein [Aetokthonos hydrillicola]MBO3462002.1 hypothetical protein [Aetokthonos hydrillicola CCALA 1050]MBW4584295.1 hypothetical protein [Aetokthonos hydrillicola CCALA 1050]MDR9898497.1 hypothetical protein [Aetokthonos hydrillicola Thurmond2011]